MKIGLITMWYNEELLAPLFLDHYNYVHDIHVIIDEETNDRTEEICKQYNNVTISYFRFPDKFNDAIKQDYLNKMVKIKKYTCDLDWLYVLDADEFIFPPAMEPAEDFLERQKGNVVSAKMWQIYRHYTESDLVSNVPAVMQRRHGDPDLTGFNSFWIKPVVVRPDVGIEWNKGCHRIKNTDEQVYLCNEYFVGGHWANADPSLAIKRRLTSKARQSEVNLRNRWQEHNHHVVEEDIILHCKEHEHDPQLY